MADEMQPDRARTTCLALHFGRRLTEVEVVAYLALFFKYPKCHHERVYFAAYAKA